MDNQRKLNYSDEELILHMQQDDQAAFEQLYHRYWHPLFIFSKKLLNSVPDAEDVVQTVFISLWEKRSQLAIIQSLQAYLFQAVRYNGLKKLNAELSKSVDLDTIHERFLPVVNTFMETLEHDELARIIEEKVSELPEKTQAIFRMSRFEHLSIREIAQSLGLSEQTVKNQLSMALKNLREGIAIAITYMLLK